MAFFSRFAMLSATAIVSQALNAAPEVPKCKCMQAWPGSTDAQKWAKGFGWKYVPSTQDYGWEVMASQQGCVNIVGYQFCVPDTSDGPCDFIGTWDTDIQMPRMMCGAPGNLTAATPELTADQKAAAYAWATKLTESGTNPLCQCEEDWSDSQLAKIYCGGNASLAKGAVGQATCASAPALMVSYDDNGTFIGGYNDKHPMLPMTKWCKVKMPTKGSCDIAFADRDSCANKELWMMAPNLMTPKTQGEIAVGQANRHSGTALRQMQIVNTGEAQQFWPMRLPKDAFSEWAGDYADKSYNFVAALANKLAAFHAQYNFSAPAAHVANMLHCDATCKETKEKQAKEASAAVEGKKDKCRNVTKCNALMESVACKAAPTPSSSPEEADHAAGSAVWLTCVAAAAAGALLW